MKKYKLSREFIIETFRYLICGMSTVIVNIATYKIFSYCYDTLIANTIAFVLSVLYAYFTNTLFVFRVRLTWKSFREFFGMRIGTIVVDNGMLLLLIWLGMNDMLAKCVVNVIIIGLNYIFSKLFIFKKK